MILSPTLPSPRRVCAGLLTERLLVSERVSRLRSQ